MRKITLIALCVIFLLCTTGCKQNFTDETLTNEKPLIVLPDASASANLNGYKKDAEQIASDISDAIYYASKSSKKFHKSTCSYAEKIKDDNIYKTNDKQELLDSGYTACKSCSP